MDRFVAYSETHSGVRYRWHAGARAVLGWLALALPCSAVAAQAGQINNGMVQLNYNQSATGVRLTLSSLQELPSNALFVLDILTPTGMWEVTARDKTTGGLTTLTPDQAAAFNLVSSTANLVATWTGVGFGGNGPTVVITALANAGEPIVLFSTQVTGMPGTHSLYKVRSPIIEVKERGLPADQRMAWPLVGGKLTPDPLSNAALMAEHPTLWDGFVYPGFISMQYCSYYDQSEVNPQNLYFGTRDPAVHNKGYQFNLRSEDDFRSMTMSVTQWPPNPIAAPAWTVPYPATLGFLRGDWYDASRFYRQWAIGQPWCANGPMRNPSADSTYSNSVKNLQVWGGMVIGECNDTPPVGCKPIFDYSQFTSFWQRDVNDQRSYLGITQGGGHTLRWYDENWNAQADFVASMPSVSPLAAIAGYFYNMEHSDMGPYFMALLPNSVKDENQAYKTRAGDTTLLHTNQRCGLGFFRCPLNDTLYTSCHSTAMMTAYAQHAASQLAAHGAKGMYIDSLSHHPAELCYDVTHNHPIADSSDYNARVRQECVDVKSFIRTHPTYPQKDFFLLSEGQQESHIKDIEIMYEHTPYQTHPVVPPHILVPMFQTVYSEHTRSGTIADRDDPTQSGPIFWRLARQYYAGRILIGAMPWWGMDPMNSTSLSAHIAADADFALFAGMVQNYVGILRNSRSRDTVMFGQRLRDPAIPMAATATGVWIYKPYNEFVQPFVYATAMWRPDLNELGVLLLNWSDTSDATTHPGAGNQTSVAFTIVPGVHGLSNGTYTLYEVATNNTETVLGTLIINGPTQVMVGTVNARSCRHFNIR